MLPYVSGVSEDIRRVCSRYNLRVIFKSGQTLRTILTRVKDRLPEEKRSKVVVSFQQGSAMFRAWYKLVISLTNVNITRYIPWEMSVLL